MYYHCEGRNHTWEVRDSTRVVLDSIPTETAAENVAREMNRAYQRGQMAKLEDIQQVLGIRP